MIIIYIPDGFGGVKVRKLSHKGERQVKFNWMNIKETLIDSPLIKQAKNTGMFSVFIATNKKSIPG